jgi:hypothetical protein
MRILQLDLDRREHINRFLRLPFRLYAGIPQWVPPLEMDARQMLDRRKHPFYQCSEAAFFLVEEGGLDLGRLAVSDNRPYNEYNHSSTAHFTLFECEKREDAGLALFEAGCDWARARGLAEMVGPKGMSLLDGMGLLVDGFEHRPAMGIPYNPPYYPALIEAAGFTTRNEIVSGKFDRTLSLPDKIRLAARAVQERRGFRVQRFRSRADLRAFVPRLKDLYNGALEGTSDTYPLSDAEVRVMADQILWFADPKLIKIIFKDDDIAGFVFAYPDISAAIQRTKGRLWPFGWADLLLELRRTKWLNINGAGILPKYRGMGATALLYSELSDSLIQSSFEFCDVVQIGMENERMQNELRALNVIFHKMHRIYRKDLG